MPSKTLCPVCGVGVPIDEDGCCAQCGATATGEGADEVLASLAAERQRAEAAELERDRLRQAVESAHYGLTEGEGREWWLAAEVLERALSASPPAAPPDPSDPLVQAVLDAAERWELEHFMNTGRTASLLAAERELAAAARALRTRKEGQGG